MDASTAKVILIAHREPDVRDRFVAALADARHAAVTASGEDEAVAVAARRPAISLAVLDVGLSPDPAAWIRRLREAAQPALPVLVFAAGIGDAALARALVPAGVAGYINDHAATASILPALAPHLFPASFDRRLAPRLALSVPVSYRSAAVIAGAVTLNVSRGGLAIRTLSPLERDAPISVRFRLPSSQAEVERTGRVVWADRRVGMGIQFDEEIDV